MDWTLTDVEAVARGKLSQLAYDYVAGGAGEERTLSDNVAAFRRQTLRPRFLVDVAKRDMSTALLGKRYPMPIGVAPTAFHRLFHEDGERGVARACAERGVLHCVSTLATTPLEEVAQEQAPRWFQVYIHRDRELSRELVQRAVNAGYEALVLTVDAPVWAIRERDRRNKFTLPPPLTLANFERYLDKATGQSGPDGLANYVNSQLDPSLTWRDVGWLRSFGLPVLVKGVLTAEDAALAIEHGAAGIIVSNHGARMLDRVPATLDVLPEIVEAVAGRVPVILDGGVRRGVDALIALATGASFVMVGRPVVWGLAAGGSAGAGRVLDLLRDELDNAMALTGCRTLADVAPTLLRRA
ncbi:MAG TPA: alpha-hydroxy acid oxidase [Candidatus Thermoplasmatota archaeon]|nr:alpha-hydroxy acid oxidase [Candidatus Thermoplasmatota archaeon]